MPSLAFIASVFTVTEENLLFETDLSGPPFLMFSLLLKEECFIFLFVVTAAGGVPCGGVPCGGP